MGTRRLMLLIVMCASGISCAAHAQMFKCDVGGKITYSDRPCESGRSSSVSIVPNLMDNSSIRTDARRLEREEAQHEADRRRLQAEDQVRRERESALAEAETSRKNSNEECERAKRALADLKASLFSAKREHARITVESKCGIALPRPKRCELSFDTVICPE